MAITPFQAPPIPHSSEGQLADVARFAPKAWPGIFTRGVIVPFAVGIYGELVDTPRPPNLNCTVIKAFLMGWTQTPQYLRALAEDGSNRYHADGRVQGPASERDRIRARLLLSGELVAYLDDEPEPVEVGGLPIVRSRIEADCYRIDRRSGRVFWQIPRNPADWRTVFEPEQLIKVRRTPRPEEVRRLLLPPRDDD
jgi:ProQ/FINO family